MAKEGGTGPVVVSSFMQPTTDYLGRGELSVRVQAEDLLKLLESVHDRPNIVVGFQRALAHFVLLQASKSVKQS